MLEAKIFNLAVTDKGFAIVIKPLKSNKVLSIFIAPLEAQAIMTSALGFNQNRPLTHDLIKNILDVCEAHVLHVIIDSVQGDTFYSKIAVEHNNKTFLIDSRPSDAIAVSLGYKVPIFIDESLVHNLGFILEEGVETSGDSKDEIPFSYQVFTRESSETAKKNESNNSDPMKEERLETTDSTLEEVSISNNDKIEKIKNLLELAVKEERYEDAAKYRDKLRQLGDLD